jgi:hypothetical protein
VKPSEYSTTERSAISRTSDQRLAISDQPSASFVGEDDGYGEKTSVSPHLPIFECSTGLATIASSGKKLIADGSLLIAHR